MTSPSWLNSGPPELPLLMAASVCVVVERIVQRAAACRDDAGRHRMAEAERVADGNHPVTHPLLVGIAPLHRRQRLLVGRLDLEQGDVDAAVGADQLGLELGVILEDDGDVLSALDHVVVGDDVAIAIDHETRSERRTAPLLLLLATTAVEELLEELLERRARRQLRHVAQPGPLLGHALRRRYVDDGRHQLVDQVGKALIGLIGLARQDGLCRQEAESCDGRQDGPSKKMMRISQNHVRPPTALRPNGR